MPMTSVSSGSLSNRSSSVTLNSRMAVRLRAIRGRRRGGPGDGGIDDRVAVGEDCAVDAEVGEAEQDGVGAGVGVVGQELADGEDDEADRGVVSLAEVHGSFSL